MQPGTLTAKESKGMKKLLNGGRAIGFHSAKEKPPTTEAEPPVFTPKWFLKKPQTSPGDEDETRKQSSKTKKSTIVQARGH
ncbi:hypothetical protein Tco_1223550 [Tanacetum coccineum]